MNNDRIEPSIDHEFTLVISTVIDRETGSPMLQFMFRTVREFSTFGYAIAVKDASKKSPVEFNFELGGLSLPAHTNNAHGGAQTAVLHKIPDDGTYQLVIRRRSRTVNAQIAIAGGVPQDVQFLEPLSFVRVEVSRA